MSKKSGFIVAAELVMISTILVLGLLVGFVSVRDAMIGELHDIAESYGEIVQSYSYQGTAHTAGNSDHGGRRNGISSWTTGSDYQDETDMGDRAAYAVTIAPDSESGRFN